MDQVLLEWDAGNTLVLARVRDAEGCWLCSREVHIKLGGGMPLSTWRQHTLGGKDMS